MRQRPLGSRRGVNPPGKDLWVNGLIVGVRALISGLQSSKLDVTAKATNGMAVAGVDDTNYMTAVRTFDAINTILQSPWKLLETSNPAAAASVDFEAHMTDTAYAYHVIQFEKLVASGTNQIGMRFKKSGAYLATGYYGNNAKEAGTSNTVASDTNGSAILLPNISGSGTIYSGTAIVLGNLLTAAYQQHVIADVGAIIPGTPSAARGRATGSEGTAAAVTGLRFISPAGDTITGTFRHYGVPNT